MRRRAPAVLILASAIGACSGPPGASASVQGTLGNATIPTTDVVGKDVASGSGTDAVRSLSVVLTNHTGLCGQATAPPDLAVLRILVSIVGSSAAATTYTIGESSATVLAVYQATDSNGVPKASSDAATAGSVTFTSIDGSALRGSFDLTFGDGHVTGTFTAPLCGS